MAKLTEAELRVLRATGDDFAQYPRAMGVLTINALRNRYKFIECEDAERGVWRYRITPAGRAALAQAEKEGAL